MESAVTDALQRSDLTAAISAMNSIQFGKRRNLPLEQSHWRARLPQPLFRLHLHISKCSIDVSMGYF